MAFNKNHGFRDFLLSLCMSALTLLTAPPGDCTLLLARYYYGPHQPVTIY